MVQLVELIPDAELVVTLEPAELGLRLLPVLASVQPPLPPLQPDHFLATIAGSNEAGYPGQYPTNYRGEILAALIEAWAWLDGQGLLVHDPRQATSRGGWTLSRRAQQLAKEPEPYRAFSARRISKEALHPAIREDVWALYHRGKYDTAVFEAMKAVEVAVREASCLAAKDIGAPLMRRAFDVNGGPLTDATVSLLSVRPSAIFLLGRLARTKMLSRTERSDSTIRTRRPRSLCSQTTFSESWTADARPEVRHESARHHHRQ